MSSFLMIKTKTKLFYLEGRSKTDARKGFNIRVNVSILTLVSMATFVWTYCDPIFGKRIVGCWQ